MGGINPWLLIVVLAVAQLLVSAVIILAILVSTGRERRELCNRLMAGTLSDYAAHRAQVEKRRAKAQPVGENIRDVEEVTQLPEGLPPQAVQEAQAVFNQIMKG